jgi:hypothetical protein
MTPRAEKLYASLSQSPHGRKRVEVDRMLKAYGFVIVSGRGPHDSAEHPEYPILRLALPRHVTLHVRIVRLALELVDELLKLRSGQE